MTTMAVQTNPITRVTVHIEVETLNGDLTVYDLHNIDPEPTGLVQIDFLTEEPIDLFPKYVKRPRPKPLAKRLIDLKIHGELKPIDPDDPLSEVGRVEHTTKVAP